MRIWIAALALMLAMSHGSVKCDGFESETSTAEPSLTCAVPRPNSPFFACVEGKWVANASITTDVLIFPRDAGDITITGNLTVTTIVFDGIASYLRLNGCYNKVDEIRILLRDSDLSEIGHSDNGYGNHNNRKLVSLGSGNSDCPNISGGVGHPDVVTDSSMASSCYRVVNAELYTESTPAIVAEIKIDNVRCKLWWIILIPVLAGIVLIILFVLLLVKCVPACRPDKNTDGGF